MFSIGYSIVITADEFEPLGLAPALYEGEIRYDSHEFKSNDAEYVTAELSRIANLSGFFSLSVVKF